MANMPGKYPIEIYQGDTYDLFFRVRESVWNPITGQYEAGAYVDLTGTVPTAMIKKSKTDVAATATFSCVLSDQTALPGGVLCTLVPTESKKLIEVVYMYDVQLYTDATHIRTFLQGSVLVTQEVTT